MKSIFKLILGAGFALSLASCGSAYDPYSGNNGGYGYPQSKVYRAGDGTVYRTGDIYRDTNGNVYQNGQIIRRGDVYGSPGILQGGNYPGNGRQLPPGQAKKIYGGSAKDYAPGQMKKRGGYYNDRDYRYNREYKDYRGNKGNKGKGYKKYKDRNND